MVRTDGRASLERYIPQLEYREWERCGHEPWRERAVRDEFFAVLHEWLAKQFTEGSSAADVKCGTETSWSGSQTGCVSS